MPPSFIRAIVKRSSKLTGQNMFDFVDVDQARSKVAEFFGSNGTGAEIGVFKGGYSQTILDKASPQKLYLIDPWASAEDPDLAKSWYAKDSEHDMERIYADVKKKFDKHISTGQVELVRRRTQEATELIADGSLDFIYIDGDHRFEGVQYDLDFAFQKVRRGGVIAADDHALGSWWTDGVVQAVNLFVGKYSKDLKIEFAFESQIVIRKV